MGASEESYLNITFARLTYTHWGLVMASSLAHLLRLSHTPCSSVIVAFLSGESQHCQAPGLSTSWLGRLACFRTLQRERHCLGLAGKYLFLSRAALDAYLPKEYLQTTIIWSVLFPKGTARRGWLAGWCAVDLVRSAYTLVSWQLWSAPAERGGATWIPPWWSTTSSSLVQSSGTIVGLTRRVVGALENLSRGAETNHGRARFYFYSPESHSFLATLAWKPSHSLFLADPLLTSYPDGACVAHFTAANARSGR